MEWLDKMNEVLQYIEENLTGQVDPKSIENILASTYARCQNLFSFLTDMTIAQYVRGRKMAEAAKEAVNSDLKIIDLALKYGYDSPEAFTRAFQAFHGMAPSMVRKTGLYHDFPPFVLRPQTEKRGILMGSKPVVRIESLENLQAVSFRASGGEPETNAWNLMREWAVPNFPDYAARKFFGFAPCGHHPEGEGCDSHEYVANMIVYGDDLQGGALQGVETSPAPRGLFLVGDVALNEYRDGQIDIGASMKKSSQVVYECMVSMGGYEMDFEGRTYLEEHLFSPEWFVSEKPETIPPQFKFWLPIRKIRP